MTGVRFQAGGWNFSLHHRVQAGSGTHPSYLISTWGSFPGDKASAAWSYTSIPPYVIMPWDLVFLTPTVTCVPGQ